MRYRLARVRQVQGPKERGTGPACGGIEDHARLRTQQMAALDITLLSAFKSGPDSRLDQRGNRESRLRRDEDCRGEAPVSRILMECVIGRQECPIYEARLTREPERTRYRT